MCAWTLLLPSLATSSQTIRPNPDRGPGQFPDTYVDYVGNFGEVFKLNDDWQIVPSMRGEIEVINYYPKYRADHPPESLTPFKPKPSDFAPGNFARMGLVQLLIIPRSADDFRSLDELRAAKVKDLQSSGVKFDVFDDPLPPPLYGGWPKGTFEVKVRAPYLLTQLYTATSSYLCILTSGIDTPPSTWIDGHSGLLRFGLTNWLVPKRESLDNEATARDIWAKGISLYPFSIPYVWIPWAGITGISCLLTGILWIKRRWDPLRRISLWLLIFSNTGAVVGGLCGLAFWSFPWFSRHTPASSAVASLFMPLVALFMNRARAKHTRRAQIGTTLWALASFLILAYYSQYDLGPGSRQLLAASMIISFVSFGIGGIIFGALTPP